MGTHGWASFLLTSGNGQRNITHVVCLDGLPQKYEVQEVVYMELSDGHLLTGCHVHDLNPR